MDGILGSSYRDARVLLTGHTGFKGSWLALWLDLLGARVAGLALDPPTDPSMYVACALDELVDSTIVDVRSLGDVSAVFTRVEPDVVFHMAAQPIVRTSYVEPVKTYETNVLGTVNVLEAARNTPSVRAVVVVTSDKCYENLGNRSIFRETDPLGGFDPYSSSKACAEIVTSAYARSFCGAEGAPVAVATARAGNVIGGGDWAVDRLVPDVVRALAHSRPAGVRNPVFARPWQHVLEPLCGYLMLGERLLGETGGYAGAWNFGPDPEGVRSVREVVDAFLAAWGSGTWETLSPEVARHEANTLLLNSDKSRQELGWRPYLDIEESVRLAAEWYRLFYAGGDVRALSRAQIAAYESQNAG